MPRFTSPEAKEKWLASVRATRAAKRGATVTVSDFARSVPSQRERSGGIAGAIEEIDSKIAALENVKKNLIHAQQLVNL